MEDLNELSKCNICLKNTEGIYKCNSCTFFSCERCIIEWFNSQTDNICPQCKRINTYGINYEQLNVKEHKIHDIILIPTLDLLISNFSLFGISEEIEDIVQDGQLFYYEHFVENFNNWPFELRQKYRYYPVKQTIDGVEETIAYRIEEIGIDVD